MARTYILLTVAASLTFVAGCTQDFNKFLTSGTGGANTSSSNSGSTSSVSSSSQSSSTGGCDPTTCPVPANECDQAACNGATCGTSPKAAGTKCMGGTKVCDGASNCVSCDMPTDCPTPATKCHLQTCTTNMCGTMNATAETPCSDNGGTVCDSMGKCVGCVMPADCMQPTTKCKIATCSATNVCGTMDQPKGTVCNDGGGTVCDTMGKCVSANCTDGIKDGAETDVDCGGPACSPCINGDTCLVGTDCQSKVCGVNGKCSVPNCMDGQQNGLETDLDCGGATCDGQGKTCADQKHCAIAADCTNGFCFGSGANAICTSCMDGAKDGNETDLDCGGAQCDAQGKTCAINKKCMTGADCTTGYCDAAGTCQLKPDGVGCTASAQCANSQCLPNESGGSNICCATACPTTATSTCGTDGNCKPGGASCADYPSTQTCVGAVCSGMGASFVPARKCDGAGACQAAVAPTQCGGNLNCAASGTACDATCTTDATCLGGASGSFYCAASGNTSCTAKSATGACTGNDQCTSNVCGISGSGNCCTAACAPTGGTCGATGCNGSGVCVFPTVACGSTCTSAMETDSTCNGSGSCVAAAPFACMNHLTCNAGGTACLSACGAETAAGDANCTPQSTAGTAGKFFCDGVGAGACQPTIASGSTSCNRDLECVSNSCKMSNHTCN